MSILDASPALAPTRWYEAPRFRRVAPIVLALYLAGEGVVAVFLRTNDWEGHRQLGIAVRTQGLPATPWPWYSLGRVTFDAALSLAPALVGRAMCYVLAVAAAWACLRMWDRMVQTHAPAAEGNAFPAAVFALLATFTLWQRDLEDCGLHMFLLFFLTTAVWHLTQERRWLGGFWLAVAIVYKTTPLLFLPFLLWKRQWRAAGWTTLFTLVLSLGPALFFGWDASMDYHRRTLDVALRSAGVRDPSENIIEKPNLENQAWTVAVARFVQTKAPGHPLHSPHPLFFQFGDLDRDRARKVVKGATLLLLVLIAWRTRRTCATPAALAMEWGAVSILAVLLSPLCWKQHLVVMLPAVFLLCRQQLQHRLPPRGRSVLLMVIAALVLLSAPDGPLGKELARLAASYKTFTVAALLAMTSLLTLDHVQANPARAKVRQDPPHGEAA